jgi:hypothetical protein
MKSYFGEGIAFIIAIFALLALFHFLALVDGNLTKTADENRWEAMHRGN